VPYTFHYIHYFYFCGSSNYLVHGSHARCSSIILTLENALSFRVGLIESIFILEGISFFFSSAEPWHYRLPDEFHSHSSLARFSLAPSMTVGIGDEEQEEDATHILPFLYGHVNLSISLLASSLTRPMMMTTMILHGFSLSRLPPLAFIQKRCAFGKQHNKHVHQQRRRTRWDEAFKFFGDLFNEPSTHNKQTIARCQPPLRKRFRVKSNREMLERIKKSEVGV
jgi:hypothetical protein